MTAAQDLERIAAPRPVTLAAASEATAIEQARSVAEVAAAVRVAQDNPRNESAAVGRMRQACGQRALADRAFYSVPRSGRQIEGPSVHLARELVRCWGNADYGIRELRRDDAAMQSEMQAWAWDQETNVRATRSFIVPHEIMVGKGADKKRKPLIDLADISNNNNSVAARAVRETVFNILPVWYREEAIAAARRTLEGGEDGKTLAQQIADAVRHYEQTFDVTAAQLEERFGRHRAEWTAANLGFLRTLATELANGERHVDGEFPKPVKGGGKITADEIKGAGDDQA